MDSSTERPEEADDSESVEAVRDEEGDEYGDRWSSFSSTISTLTMGEDKNCAGPSASDRPKKGRVRTPQ